MKVKYCSNCGTMHINADELCSECQKEKRDRERKTKKSLLNNKYKYARFEGGVQV